MVTMRYRYDNLRPLGHSIARPPLQPPPHYKFKQLIKKKKEDETRGEKGNDGNLGQTH